MHHRLITDSEFVIAGSQGAILLEPTDTTLDEIAQTIVRLVVAHRSSHFGLGFAMTLLGWNDSLHAMVVQPVADACDVIRFVRRQPLGTSPHSSVALTNSNTIHYSFKLLGLMCLTTGQAHGQGDACTVTEQVQLGAITAA